MIQGFAVGERMGAGRIVADHAADGGAVGGRSVGAELQPHAAHVSVELILNQPRLDAAPELFVIHLQYALHILGKVEHDGMADRLAGKRRPAAARQHRYAELVGDLDHRLHIAFMARHHHAHGLDLIDRRVGGVKQP